MIKPRSARAKARRQGWLDWIQTENDERAACEGYYFDLPAAELVRDFLGLLRLTDGEWKDRPLKLMDWQWRGIVGPLFGWKRPNGLRRFRRGYEATAKKNGKSGLASGLSLYMLMMDGESGAEVYVAACDRAQAGIIFNESARMIAKSPTLSKRLDVIASQKRITYPATYSAMQALSADVRTKEGLKLFFGSFDELHAQPNDKLWNVLKFAMASRQEPLLLSWTTAGDTKDPEHICRRQYNYAKGVLDGTIPDLHYHAYIAEAPADADWTKVKTWKAANPGWGVTVKVDQFHEDFAQAKGSAVDRHAFRRYRLNQWVSSNVLWIKEEQWAARAVDFAQAVEDLDLENRPRWIGLDLAECDDINAKAEIWKITTALEPDPNNEDAPTSEDRYYCRFRFYVPQGTVDERIAKGIDPTYQEWIARGWMIALPGEVVNQDYIKQAIIADHEAGGVIEVGYDPWQALKLVGELDAEGIECVKIPQTLAHLSEPSKAFERAIRDGRIYHDGNPVMAWMIAHCNAYIDPNKNIRPDKKHSGGKIDGVAALISGLARAIPGDADLSQPTITVL